MGKYFEKSTTKKFGVNKSGGIQKRSFNNNSNYGFGSRGGQMGKKSKYTMSDEDMAAPDWDNLTLKPFKKDFYVPHDNVAQR